MSGTRQYDRKADVVQLHLLGTFPFFTAHNLRFNFYSGCDDELAREGISLLVIIGVITVIAAVFGGFLIEGGHLAVLLQPVEFLIILGAAGGSLMISSPPSLLKA
ncbi:MAG: motility-associated protein, partial [Bdellovibrionia bacterium]